MIYKYAAVEHASVSTVSGVEGAALCSEIRQQGTEGRVHTEKDA